jgi:hypothetical protein
MDVSEQGATKQGGAVDQKSALGQGDVPRHDGVLLSDQLGEAFQQSANQSSGAFQFSTDRSCAAGYWAQRLWVLDGCRQRVSVRRLHYFAVVKKNSCVKPDGTVYQNTLEDLAYLIGACRQGRYMGLLPYDVFARSSVRTSQMPRLLPGDKKAFDYKHTLIERLESFRRVHAGSILSKVMPVHVELWLERSSAFDLLWPIADTFNVNLVASEGEISLSEIWLFIRRIANTKNPVRIFYASDHYPGSENGPTPAERKLKLLLCQYKLCKKIDLKFKRLLLSESQSKHFHLPCAPRSSVSASYNIPSENFLRNRRVELHSLEVVSEGYISRTFHGQLKKYIDGAAMPESRRTVEYAALDTLPNLKITL